MTLIYPPSRSTVILRDDAGRELSEWVHKLCPACGELRTMMRYGQRCGMCKEKAVLAAASRMEDV